MYFLASLLPRFTRVRDMLTIHDQLPETVNVSITTLRLESTKKNKHERFICFDDPSLLTRGT